MEYKSYPKWLYAAGGKSVLVANEDEHKALGKGWVESPADVDKKPVAGSKSVTKGDAQ